MAPRIALPPEAYGIPDGQGNLIPLEFIHYPLFSCLQVAGGSAWPRTLSWFSYQRGQPLPGTTVVSTQFHTNMESTGMIPAPRTFTCYGVRICASPLDYLNNAPALADATSGAGVVNFDQIQDALSFWGLTIFELRQGNAQEAVGPAWLFPQNVGLDGVVGESVNANAASVFQNRVAVHSSGQYYDLSVKPFVLWPLQQFTATLGFEWTADATAGTGTQLNDTKLFWCVLDGILGREIQG